MASLMQPQFKETALETEKQMGKFERKERRKPQSAHE
jgi:hypothetical protein